MDQNKGFEMPYLMSHLYHIPESITDAVGQKQQRNYSMDCRMGHLDYGEGANHLHRHNPIPQTTSVRGASLRLSPAYLDLTVR